MRHSLCLRLYIYRHGQTRESASASQLLTPSPRPPHAPLQSRKMSPVYIQGCSREQGIGRGAEGERWGGGRRIGELDWWWWWGWMGTLFSILLPPTLITHIKVLTHQHLFPSFLLSFSIRWCPLTMCECDRRLNGTCKDAVSKLDTDFIPSNCTSTQKTQAI